MADFLVFLNRFVLSLAGFPLVAWLWHRHAAEGGGHAAFTAVVMGIPLLFGYLVPGIAIVKLRLWEVRSRFSIKGIQAHQGFIYGSGLALDAWACDHVRFPHPAATVALSALLMGCVVAFTGWFIDIAGVKAGRIVVDNPPARLGRDPATIVTWYAPASYFVLGVSYMLSIHLARHLLIDRGLSGAGPVAGVFLAGFLITSVPIILVYLRLQRKAPVP